MAFSIQSVDLRPHGHVLRGQCCFHEGASRQDSMVVYLDEKSGQPKNWSCHGCQQTGRIWDGTWLLGPEEEPPLKGSLPTVEKVDTSRMEKPGAMVPEIPDRYQEVLVEVWRIFKENFEKPSCPGGLYLAWRNITPNGRYEVGYDPGGRLLFERGLPLDALLDLGLVKRDGEDRFSNRIILPLTWNGKINAFHGRLIDPRVTATVEKEAASQAHQRGHFPAMGTRRHLYTSITAGDPEHRVRWRRGVYNEAALEGRQVTLVEGALDAVGAKLFGLQNVCALGGLANPLALNKLDGLSNRILVSFDNDRSDGVRATERLLNRFGDRAMPLRPLGADHGIKDWLEAREAKLAVEDRERLLKELVESLSSRVIVGE